MKVRLTWYERWLGRAPFLLRWESNDVWDIQREKGPKTADDWLLRDCGANWGNVGRLEKWDLVLSAMAMTRSLGWSQRYGASPHVLVCVWKDGGAVGPNLGFDASCPWAHDPPLAPRRTSAEMSHASEKWSACSMHPAWPAQVLMQVCRAVFFKTC